MAYQIWGWRGRTHGGVEQAQLGFYNNQGQFTVEPGTFDVWAGDSSVGGLHGQFTVR